MFIVPISFLYSIQLGTKIGEGAFGRVMKGIICHNDPNMHMDVAVKMQKNDTAIIEHQQQELFDLIKVRAQASCESQCLRITTQNIL